MEYNLIMNIYLIRHAKTTQDKNGFLQDEVLSSPFKRALSSANYLLDYLHEYTRPHSLDKKLSDREWFYL